MCDNTINGECSGCGGCCTSLLPTSKQERQQMKAYAEAHGICPQLPQKYDDMVYLRCPYLDTSDKCSIYPARPAICRAYSCGATVLECLNKMADHDDVLSEAQTFNLWEMYGLTGIRCNGHDVVPGDDLPRVLMTDEDGVQYEIRLGRPVRARLKNGVELMDFICLDVQLETFTVFSPDANELVITRYEDVECLGSSNRI